MNVERTNRTVYTILRDAKCFERLIRIFQRRIEKTLAAFAHRSVWNAATFNGRTTETEREFFFDRYCTSIEGILQCYKAVVLAQCPLVCTEAIYILYFFLNLAAL